MHTPFRRVLCLTLLTFGLTAQAATIDAQDGVCTIDVPSGDTNISTLDLTKLTGNDLVKTGAGRLVIDTSLAALSWDGEIGISNGYVRLTVNGALGGTTKGTFVADGATLEIDSTSLGKNKLSCQTEPITIRGKGVSLGSGKYAGAINNEFIENYAAFGKVKLADDALLRSIARTDIRSYTFDMNGHTLTVQGEFGLAYGNLLNPGQIRIEKCVTTSKTYAGTLYLEETQKMNGSDQNVLTLADGCNLICQGFSTPVMWSIVTEGSLTMKSWKRGVLDAANTFAGPMTLGGTLSVDSSDTCGVTFGGKISGTGSLTTYNRTGRYQLVRLTNAANDFTGTITAQGGYHIQASYPGSLGAYGTAGHVIANRGFIEAMVGTGNWSDAQLKTLFRNATASLGGAAVAYLEPGTSYDFNDAMAEEQPISIGHAGTNSTFNLVGAFENTNVSLVNVSGTMALAGEKTWRLMTANVTGGDLEVSDGALLAMTNLSYVAAAWPEIARLTVTNAQLQTSPEKTNTKLQIGKDAAISYGRGIIELQNGSNSRIRFDTGFSSLSGMGSIILRGGSYVKNMSEGGGKDGYLGATGGGYLEIGAGAAMEESGYFVIGSASTGRAVLAQLGGRYKHETWDQGLVTSAGGKGGSGYSSLYFAGGTTYVKPNIQVCKCVWNEDARNGRGSVDVDGTADVTITENIYLGAHSNAVGTANLKGGTLTLKQFCMPTNGVQFRPNVNVPFTDNRSYVNLNGGTIRAQADTSLFAANLTRVTLFAGGASFDVTNRNVTLGHTVVAASGNGISSIPLPPAASTPWAYIGAPYVEINDDGGGTGASAVALFDSVNGIVTNVVVTSPGCGYTDQTRVTFSCGGWTNTVVVTPTLAANATAGGLTVKGTTGTLTLQENELPLGEGLSLEGGTLDPGVQSLTVKTLSGVNGTVRANVKVTDELVIDCAKMSPGCQYVIDGQLDLDGATIRVVNLDESETRFKLANFLRATGGIVGNWTMDPACPEPWTVLRRGNTLTFHCERGLLLIVR